MSSARHYAEHKGSSFISGTTYDEGSKELTVHLRSGRNYVHPGVPLHEVNAMRNASSVGAYYNATIKPRYPHKP